MHNPTQPQNRELISDMLLESVNAGDLALIHPPIEPKKTRKSRKAKPACEHRHPRAIYIRTRIRASKKNSRLVKVGELCECKKVFLD